MGCVNLKYTVLIHWFFLFFFPVQLSTGACFSFWVVAKKTYGMCFVWRWGGGGWGGGGWGGSSIVGLSKASQEGVGPFEKCGVRDVSEA